MRVSFFSELIETVTDRGRRLLSLAGGPLPQDGMQGPSREVVSRLCGLAEALLSGRGEASGVALARTLLDAYAGASPSARLAFLGQLTERFGADELRLARAVEGFRSQPGPGESGEHPDRSAQILELHKAAEPRRQELFRRLNLAPRGTAALVGMREEVLAGIAEDPRLRMVDADFAHLFGSWFNRGFLVLQPIDWATPANILEKIIRYEAVHAIRDWDDLRRRIEPPDRRCFAFFHPALVDEPLIFVEVALTRDIPGAIAPLLAPERSPIAASEARTAVFYSISNCQKGLAGISFGNFLIKQVAEDLRRALPNLATFVTLSPMPGFAAWLDAERRADLPNGLVAEDRDALRALDEPGWHEDPAALERLRKPLLSAAASYLLKAKNSSGKPLDPVARFHLGNGARLERLNPSGDLSANGLLQSYGLMVNYLYDLDAVEANHEAFAERGQVAASSGVRRLVRADLASRALTPFA
jgi:malonyl-CoA decarboxylase